MQNRYILFFIQTIFLQYRNPFEGLIFSFVMGSILSSSGPRVLNPMAQQFVKNSIAKQRVVIFSKSFCPYCTMAKEVRTLKLRNRSDSWFFISIVAIQKAELWFSRYRVGRSSRLSRHPSRSRWHDRCYKRSKSLPWWQLHRRWNWY